jgi:SAM-dependent methyltransferase
MASHKENFYPETSFGGFSNCDGTIAFYTRVNALIRPSFVVVDFGCGRGQHAEDPVEFRRALQSFKGKVAKVIGLDVDVAGQSNPTIDEFRALVPGQPWPVEDRSVNLIVCDSVLEHLPEPRLLFCEARRALVDGGFLCVRTTNLLSYVGLAAKLMPNRLHNAVLSRVQKIRPANDVFPTLYRCNTIAAIRRQMRRHGFRAVVHGHTPEPSYFNFSKLAYGFGVLHQKVTPGSLGTTIFAFGQLMA